MNTLIISGSPNKIGLTASVVETIINQLNVHNVNVEHINLKKRTIVLCKSCGEKGWGECLHKHFCGLKDDFNSIYKDMNDFDIFIFISPVYFHETSEVFKTFFDRLKRCDVLNPESKIKGKLVINIATASESGTKECLSMMKRLTDMLEMKTIKNIGITKSNFMKKEKTIKKEIDNMVKRFNSS